MRAVCSESRVIARPVAGYEPQRLLHSGGSGGARIGRRRADAHSSSRGPSQTALLRQCTAAARGSQPSRPSSRVHALRQPAVASVSIAPQPHSNMDLGTLFLASLLPVLKVALLCSAGAVMAIQGVLTLEGRRVVSGLIFNLFVPCLFLDKLGSGFGIQDAFKLWALTFNHIASYVLCGLLGLAVVFVTRTPPELRRHVILAVMLGNVGNLPLVLIGSLGDDPTLAGLGGAVLGMQYVILSNFAGTFLQVPLATLLLKRRDSESDNDSESDTPKPIIIRGPQHTQGDTDNTQHPHTTQQDSQPLLASKHSAADSDAPTPSHSHTNGYPRDLRSLPSAARPLLSRSDLSISHSHNHSHVDLTGLADYTSRTERGDTHTHTSLIPTQPTGTTSHDRDALLLTQQQSSIGGVNDGSTGIELQSPGSATGIAKGPHAALKVITDTHTDTQVQGVGTGAVGHDERTGGALANTPASRADNADLDTLPLLSTQRTEGVGKQQGQGAQGGIAAKGAGGVRGAVRHGRAAVARHWSALKPFLDSLISPPTVACVVALTIASVPWLKALFFSPTGALRLVGEVVGAFGNMAIPSLMLVLGANLSRGPGVSSIPMRVVVGTVVARLIVMPLLGTPLVLALREAGVLTAMQPIGIIVMLLNHAVPTAILVHSMATLYRSREDDVAALLFYEYIACAVTLPFIMMFFLHLVMS